MGMFKIQSFLIFFLFSLCILCSKHLAYVDSYYSIETGGTWVLLQESIGISTMHMQVLYNNKVIMFDRTDFGLSNISLPGGNCRLNDEAVFLDCTAHSVLYDIASNTIRPLMILTNAWCSSGSVDSVGTLVQTGGDKKGERVIRTFTPCDDDSCDWVELSTPLFNRRWYSSNQILPDGRIIIVGGRRVFTYEFYPKNSLIQDNRTLPFLVKTRDPQEENNLYPFLHLLPDGNLFIFANNRSILFDYNRNHVIKEYPVLPGGSRNFPCTGSSVLLPLRLTGGIKTAELMPEAEVLICGGSTPGAYIKANVEHVYVEATRTCGRLKVMDPNPEWVMEFMPTPRIMNDLLLLPSGDVLIINGATNGSAGWNDAVNPVLNPVLYLPDAAPSPTQRFVVLNPSNIPRMYHSTAALLPDGRVLVGGSNPHPTYNFTASPYPTELSLEAYYPPYLAPMHAELRPSILTVEAAEKTVSYNGMFAVTFVLSVSIYPEDSGITVELITPSFCTHSSSMNQRMVVLKVMNVEILSSLAYKVSVVGPTNANVAPPGYYMLFVVHARIPSQAVWVKVQ